MTAEVVPFPHSATRSSPSPSPRPQARRRSARERGRGDHSSDLVLVAAALRDASPRILDNWAIRVSTMPLFRAIPDLTLADLRQEMPAVLEAALLAVTSSSFAVDLAPLADAVARGEQHGRARRAVAPLDVLLAEFHALRREIRNQLWRVAETHVPEHDRRELVIRDLDDRLTSVLDETEQAAAVAWVVTGQTVDVMAS